MFVKDYSEEEFADDWTDEPEGELYFGAGLSVYLFSAGNKTNSSEISETDD